MSGLDKLFAAATRHARNARLGVGLTPHDKAAVSRAAALVGDATSLLPEHPDRGAEIALLVQRLGLSQLVAAGHGGAVASFAHRFAELAHSRLPPPSEPMTRTQAREALVSFAALKDLRLAVEAPGSVSAGTNIAELDTATAALASRVADSAQLLDVPAAAAALGKVGAAASSESGKLVDGDSQVALALQSRLSDENVLAELNDNDFLAATAAVVSAVEILPAAASAIVAASAERLQKSPPLSAGAACDLVRMMLSLRMRVSSGDIADPADGLLSQAWSLLADVVIQDLSAALSSESTSLDAAQKQHALAARAGAAAAGLARVGEVALSTDGPFANDFAKLTLGPCAPFLQQLASQYFDTFELVAPLIRAAAGARQESAKETEVVWIKFLAHAALEGLPAIPPGTDNALRVLNIAERVLETGSTDRSASGTISVPAFPPFFDFVMEDILGRLGDIHDPRDFRRVARLLGQAHLERPDLLGGAAAAVADAAVKCRRERLAPGHSNEELAEVALSLSSFAALYVRLATAATTSVAASGSQGGVTGITAEAALGVVAVAMDAEGVLCERLIERSAEFDSEAAHGEVVQRNRDAECLALSALAQATLKAGPREQRGGSSSSSAPTTLSSGHAATGFNGFAGAELGQQAQRQLLSKRGLGMLETLSAAWIKDKGLGTVSVATLSPPQMHIFVTALRGFCSGTGAPQSPPPSAAALLQQLLARAMSAPAGDQDARLVLAMFEEFAADPSCPDTLKSMLQSAATESNDSASSNSGRAGSSEAANRFRQHIQATAAAAEPSSGPGFGAATGRKGGLLRRLFGI